MATEIAPLLLVSPTGVVTAVAPREVSSLLAQGWSAPTASQANNTLSAMQRHSQTHAPNTPTGGYGVFYVPNENQPLGQGSSALDEERRQRNAIEVARALFPWAEQIGLLDLIRAWVAQGFEGEGLVAQIRQTGQWANFFQGIRESDGRLRMNEGEFLRRRDELKSVLREFGRPDYEYDDPADFKPLFDAGLDANQLRRRFEVWRGVQQGGQDVRDAFYVYAGMRPTDEDLYNAVVFPEEGRLLTAEFQQRMALQKLDYNTWLTRATEVGLSRVVRTLQDLERRGAVTGHAIYEVARVDPDFARQMMDVLFHGGSPEAGPYLNLDELLNSFELALIGSVAVQQGLALPTRDRIQAIRAAGVDRARALETYSEFSSQRNLIEGMVQRSSGRAFTQQDFEEAVLLQQADEAEILRRAQLFERSLGRGGGFAPFQQTGGRLRQPSLRSPAT